MQEEMQEEYDDLKRKCEVCNNKLKYSFDDSDRLVGVCSKCSRKQCRSETKEGSRCLSPVSIGDYCMAHYHIIKEKMNKRKRIIKEKNE